MCAGLTRGRVGGHFCLLWTTTKTTIMIARAFSPMNKAGRMMRVAGQQVRFNSNLPIPPKIATPKSVQGENAANTEAVVNFYKALPKGSEPERRATGIKAKYFDGKNASGKPLLWVIAGLMLFGYTLEYNGHLSTLARCARGLTNIAHRAPQECAPLSVFVLCFFIFTYAVHS